MNNKIELAQDIIDKHSVTAPVNLENIAKDLGLRIMYTDMEYGISGAIKKDQILGGHEGYVILVNNKDHIHRQRFTIAHEIAHFILHKNYIGDGITEDALYRSGLSNSMERQANMVAVNILLPESLVYPLMEKHQGDIASVASELKVSKKTLNIYLE